jgi:hypothetical protein
MHKHVKDFYKKPTAKSVMRFIPLLRQLWILMSILYSLVIVASVGFNILMETDK